MESDLFLALELVTLERRCPECGDDNLYFLPRDPGEAYSVECDTCGWDAEFDPEQVAEVRELLPDSAWQTIDNWQEAED
jgi:rubredoxin